jgi:hypothetical protein
MIDRSTWPAMAKRLRRLGASFLRIPAPDGCYVVLASAGDGEPVNHLAGTLASAFDQMPLTDAQGRPDRARVSSSRTWSEAMAKTGIGGDGKSGYELLGFARKPLAQVTTIARENGWYVDRVADREMAAGWAEAHLLRFPCGDTLAWRRFSRWIGLHHPERHRGQRAVRAA